MSDEPMFQDGPVLKKVLDRGYVEYIDHMGSDASFVEAARMSTGKGFYGWYWEEDTYSNCQCNECGTHHLVETLPTVDCEDVGFSRNIGDPMPICTTCWSDRISMVDSGRKLLGKKGAPRDFALLNTLYANNHATPFEMGELVIEVKAPIFVYREWHRHRTQSYNEFSARYSMMPNEHYVPELDRFAPQKSANKQASSINSDGVWNTEELRPAMRQGVMDVQKDIYDQYERYLQAGVPKEVARVNTPVSRYSRMRAKANIRNWLGFLRLRMDPTAQWEIRQYANAVASIINELFPRTFELFLEHDLLAVKFSRSEMKALKIVMDILMKDHGEDGMGVLMKYGAWKAFEDTSGTKEIVSLAKKLEGREHLFKDVLSTLEKL